MKLKILISAGVWLLLITLAHVSLNVGFANLAQKVRVLFGEERAELLVGFLPVT